MTDMILQTAIFFGCVVIGAATSISMDSYVPLATVMVFVGIAGYVINIRAATQSNSRSIEAMWKKLDRMDEKLDDIQRHINWHYPETSHE